MRMHAHICVYMNRTRGSIIIGQYQGYKHQLFNRAPLLTITYGQLTCVLTHMSIAICNKLSTNWFADDLYTILQYIRTI